MSDEKRAFLMVSREFFKHPFWVEKRAYSKAEAWLDMIQTARWDASEFIHWSNGKPIPVVRGQLVGSIRFLMQRWNWASTTKVDNFLKFLLAQDMIKTEQVHGERRITICNYDKYNTPKDSEQTGSAQQANSKATASEQQSDSERTNKKESNNSKIQEPKKEITPPPTGDELTETEIFLIPEVEKQGFAKVLQYILASVYLKKIPQQLTPKQFCRWRENYDLEQILKVLEAMENSKSIRGKTSLYLTGLNFLKTNFGTAEVKQCYERFEKIYRDFCERVVESKPKIDANEERALRSIIAYLLENNTAAKRKWEQMGKPENDYPTDIPGAILRWEYILNNWNRLDNFRQKKIRLVEIDKDIINIIQVLRDANKQQQSNNVSYTTGQNQSTHNDHSKPKNFGGGSANTGTATT